MLQSTGHKSGHLNSPFFSFQKLQKLFNSLFKQSHIVFCLELLTPDISIMWIYEALGTKVKGSFNPQYEVTLMLIYSTELVRLVVFSLYQFLQINILIFWVTGADKLKSEFMFQSIKELCPPQLRAQNTPALVFCIQSGEKDRENTKNLIFKIRFNILIFIFRPE